MSSYLFEDATPQEIKDAKVPHLLPETYHFLSTHSLHVPYTPLLLYISLPSSPWIPFTSLTQCTQGLHLITQSTPNGQKVQIMLEELQLLYPTLSWTQTLINIATNEQKKDWFLRLDPNGRIPVLVDKTKTTSPGGAFTVHETSAELLYLLKEYDERDELGFKDELERSQALQWLFFWHGSGAPYQGQLNHFGKFAKEKIPYAIERFRNETLRVYGVLEIHLSGKYSGEAREYLAGSGKGSSCASPLLLPSYATSELTLSSR